MLNDQRHRINTVTPTTIITAAPAADDDDHEGPSDNDEFRDIHPLATPSYPSRGRRREIWDGGSYPSSSLSVRSDAAVVENFTSMSREFSAMVVAGSTMHNDSNSSSNNNNVDGGQNQLARIGEDALEETNPLAIVPDSNPIPSPRRPPPGGDSAAADSIDELAVHLVMKEEVASKISAWQTAEVAKINNRCKRQEVIISGWESEQVEKASAWLKKVEVPSFINHIPYDVNEMMQLSAVLVHACVRFHEQRKLDEQRAKAMEKMQNDVAKAHKKAVEKRASAEAKRGTKVVRVFELANFMRAVGRAPSKRSFF
ncbi:hypothetical protein GW17_00029885 [Ensete ventricosum]|nr:hypothetical protein GW17_00029885 [Ensete ventricosum]RZS15385.1 hypothetical protein BHM03_00047223 [Ensete ventricosum]